MSQSVASRASNASSKMLQEIANRSQAKIYRVEGTFNDEEMRIIWNSLGLYISRNLRMGRGVHIPKLGLFTFTPPEVRLKGVTNEIERDQKPRTPVFLLQKEFIKGLNLKTAIFYHQQFGSGLRPYSNLGPTGEVPITKMNLIEISSYANMPKDQTELALNRIIKYIQEKIIGGESISLQIPNVGQLIRRNNFVAVKFNEHINRQTRNILSKSLDQRKSKGNMNLTTDNLKKFANLTHLSQRLGNKSTEFFDIDNNAVRYLQENFDLHLDSSNIKRSTTNFDRTVASKMFDRTNKSLKDSQNFRMTQSGFLESGKNLNKEYNMALKIVREWANRENKSSQQCFVQFCVLGGKKSLVLNESELWKACKQISIDITQQQGQQLFRILDVNKDGLITLEDWKNTIKCDQNNKTYQQLLAYIKKKRYSITQILNILQLENVQKVDVFALKTGLLKLWPTLNHQDALLLSQFISQNKNYVEIQKIIDMFNMAESSEAQVEVDSQWEDSFFSRIKRKMNEKRIFEEEVQNKLRFYDKNKNGYIEQSDLKTVLSEIGVNITLSELIKLVKLAPLNSQNHLQYSYLIDKLMSSSTENNQKELTEGQFIRIVKDKVFSSGSLPFNLPISVTKLTNILQTKYFKTYSENQVLPFVKKIDVNSDNQISLEDVQSYREIIREKSHKNLSQLSMENLLIKLREKSIKKKISFYDLFKKIDKAGNGFITRQSWSKNLDEIIVLTFEEKENLFNFLDKQKLEMIDYKVFLQFLNGRQGSVEGEKFDWAENTLERIKKWYKDSKLTLEDAFKVLDKDGDSYINEKDFHKFLIEKLKYQERELSVVRIQKLIKIMDVYKRGYISFLNWHRVNSQNTSWLKDAKQQIGIVLSRLHSSLSDAFTQITQGDNKMVYQAFERWVKAHHILSGFMINEDILKYIFSDLDQHKKGYLLENDFLSLFGSYNWKSQQTSQFVDFLKIKFNSCQQAFKCMASYSKAQIDFYRFKAFVSELFGQKFKEQDCGNIWKNIAGSKSVIVFQDFQKLYGHLWREKSNPIDQDFPKDDWKYQDFSIIKGTQIRTSQHFYKETEKMQSQCVTFMNNVKEILLSSPKSLEQAFMEVDPKNSGRVTNLMFKKAFRNLNIALTSKEIDLLLNYCDFKLESLINWREFVKILNLKEEKQQIIDRLSSKIQHLSDLLHYYMISPKDAFRKWNNQRSGYLNFQEFHIMLKDLYNQAGEALPEYQQLKDLFEHIDIRRDNHLDFQEFTQVFRNCNPPSLLMGTTPAPTNKLISKLAVDSQKDKPIREKSIPLFRHSPEYEKFVKLIGRNRRFLQEEIEKVKTSNQALIPFQIVEKIIREFAHKHHSQTDEGMIRNLIAFSMTGEKVDYHLLLSKFKDLSVEITEFPKKNIF